MASSLPLFPLNAVLFPTMPLPLHVFEERYKRMIRDCLDSIGVFGVVLLADKPEVGRPITRADLPAVGTVARIVAYENLPDGRYAVNARGIERFAIEAVEQESPHLVVTAIERPMDASQGGPPDDKAQRLHALFDRFHQLAQGRGMTGPRTLPVPTDAQKLAWFIAGILPIEPKQKQLLLEIDSLDRLVEAEIQILQANLPHLEEPD